MKKIVIYGGSFSPPHIGHAAVLEAMIRLFPCDEVWIMPSADRADKIISASGEHRLKMWQILLDEMFSDRKIPVIVSDLELKRNKKTETYETMLELQQKYPDSEFHYVFGADILGDVETKWENGDKLYQEMNFLVMKNPVNPLPERLPDHIQFFESAWFSFSSTFVRNVLASGGNGLPYLTKGVADYIAKNGLYK